MIKGPLWQPSLQQIEASQVTKFIAYLESTQGVAVGDFHGLYQWSISHSERFWSGFWDFSGIIAQTKGERILHSPQGMFKAQFFPDAQLNYAENLLRRKDDTTAITFMNETSHLQTLSWQDLTEAVSRLSQAFRAKGLKAGDRVAGFLPSIPEAVIAMLATTAVGGVWSSCSPDFGVNGVIDRFGQIEPKFLVSADGYLYGGKVFDTQEKLREIQARLPSLVETILVPYMDLQATTAAFECPTTLLSDFIAPYEEKDIFFEPVSFHHPLFIMFTSGTTGTPKCIVHGVGGTLLQHLKEHRLHCDIRPGDRVFYFSTCGWMMWNWLVTALASEAAIVLYDGAPTSPHETILFDYADKVGMTLFGVSAKYIDTLKKGGVDVMKTHKLDSMRMITSTGSPLATESFDYVYQKIKADICLASISGGTDILSCFVLGAPVLPVWRGEIQTRGLGMKVDVFDNTGKPLHGQKGELVCTAPFPSMPIGFWNDPEDKRYREAYFSKYDDVWCHGDLTEIKPHGGLVIYGRSDTVLNPGGVRIGTGEIYRQVEQMSEVLESLAIGQDWDNDVRIVLFVRLKSGVVLDTELVQRIKKQIRVNASPRHMPAKVIQVTDIPRTKSGKIVEIAVRDMVHGKPVTNTESLANPEALELYKNLSELQI